MIMNLKQISIKHILYTTDLSEGAKNAFSYAAGLADLFSARLAILHVMTEDPHVDSWVSGYISKEKWEEIKNRNYEEVKSALIGKKRDHLVLKEMLDTFSKNTLNALQLSPDADEILVVRGDPVQEILGAAEELQSDLIVMSTHGRGSYGKVMARFIGSTAQKVIKKSSIPVLVIPFTET